MVEAPPIDPLTQLLSDLRDDVAVLVRTGNASQAEYVVELSERLKKASEDFTTWLPEKNAMLKAGWSDRTMRRRFPELLECGLARWVDGERQFLACAVPQRADVEGARQRARVTTR